MPNDQEDDSQQRFKLEYFIRETLASLDNVFILAVLDCCRTKNPQKKIPVRGYNSDDSLDEVNNLIIIYSCPPGNVTRGDSLMTKSLLNRLREIYNKADNSLFLNEIQFGKKWIPRGGEIMSKNP